MKPLKRATLKWIPILTTLVVGCSHSPKTSQNGVSVPISPTSVPQKEVSVPISDRHFACSALVSDESLKPELSTFTALARATVKFEESIQKLAHLAAFFDPTGPWNVEFQNLRAELFKGANLSFLEARLEAFGQWLLKECVVARQGKSNKVARLQCGRSDFDISPDQRTHLKITRDWLNLDSYDRDIKIRDWVYEMNRTFDTSTVQHSNAHTALLRCARFSKHSNIEDLIEQSFLCLAAFQIKNVENAGGSEPFKECSRQFLDHEIQTDDRGFPLVSL